MTAEPVIVIASFSIQIYMLVTTWALDLHAPITLV